MAQFLAKGQRQDEILEASSEFAKLGLRTLIFARRELSEEEFLRFKCGFEGEDGDAAMRLIEGDMQFIGGGSARC